MLSIQKFCRIILEHQFSAQNFMKFIRFWRITRLGVDICQKLADSEIIHLSTNDKSMVIIRLDPNLNNYSTSNHQFYDSTTIGLSHQNFDICLEDKPRVRTPTRWTLKFSISLFQDFWAKFCQICICSISKRSWLSSPP